MNSRFCELIPGKYMNEQDPRLQGRAPGFKGGGVTGKGQDRVSGGWVGGGGRESENSVCPCPLLQFLQFTSVR